MMLESESMIDNSLHETLKIQKTYFNEDEKTNPCLYFHMSYTADNEYYEFEHFMSLEDAHELHNWLGHVLESDWAKQKH